MSVVEKIKSAKSTAFSFELLPPLKGNGIETVYKTIDTLREFDPKYINITTHRSEVVFKEMPNGLFERVAERHRPGTVAVAAAIQNKYQIPVVPHIICSGFTKDETEYALIDLQFLGITDLLLLRGDKAKHEKQFIPTGHCQATELQGQVNNFNEGLFLDGTKMKALIQPFSYGMACYPEKHDEAPNLDSDLRYAKQKVDNGAEYLVTQMFFDNEKYYRFVDKCRSIGISVPIIPGIKPVTLMNQLTVLPKIFHTDIPEAFAAEMRKCKTDADAVEVGVEWAIQQAKDLIAHNVPSIHFYSMMATQSVKRVAQAVF
ncbi:methylenetetrahydrofolate reductase [NAD(P)H] [Paludibacter sp. 221]|uniref:methylenetetrahydrofolate reductase [NAD(P)H] n=1 Tax=Paludibacter sp. 221 TaxID=2302939 RepID=UPI0013D806A9|nr:methylenetetrahydrofolate reductase [NAD(P)H] [Paludibacter sp. 221]NDV47007.1 methylenetetrahydrofolate reductase [NAD(P)H] [Paludibacter sp. 221]